MASKYSVDFMSLDQSKTAQKQLDPLGFAPFTGDSSQKVTQKEKSAEDDANLKTLKLKKAWDVALAPGKSIPMNAFMLYMSGNSVQIFSILITVMLFFNAAKAIAATKQAFEKFGDESEKKGGLQAILSDPLLLPKVVFVLSQFGVMGLGVWKCGAMGLLPTAQSDWLAFLEPKTIVEYSAGGFMWK
ncbi:hypothetical protein HDU67_006274 [Dinochytrium kinnereticum]|nr:hypothetical protein HDU67_006274 [Dinochytrium kinnereticum]